MEQTFMLPILYCQYIVCWRPGDLRSQGISRHGIDQISQNIPSLALEELTLCPLISLKGKILVFPKYPLDNGTSIFPFKKIFISTYLTLGKAAHCQYLSIMHVIFDK